MSEVQAPLPPPSVPLPPPAMPHVAETPDERRLRQQRLLREISTNAAVVAAWFAAAGLLGAFIWEKVTTLPTFTRIATTGSMDEEQLSHQFAINGWFMVIAAIGGLVSGIVLLLIRRESPAVMIVLVGLGSGLATLLMVRCGFAWGPVDPSVALAHAKLGDKVPIQLKPDVNAVYYVWSIAALLGSALALWVREGVANRKARSVAGPSPASAG